MEGGGRGNRAQTKRRHLSSKEQVRAETWQAASVETGGEDGTFYL